MYFTLFKKAVYTFSRVSLLLLLLSVIACQPQTEKQEASASETTSEANTNLTIEKRPAPTFFIIPAELAKKRVWILDNEYADVFHLKHDCPVLIEGKGKGTFRNISLNRAIEEYGRYNCQVCSKELDHIFDEDMIRAEH